LTGAIRRFQKGEKLGPIEDGPEGRSLARPRPSRRCGVPCAGLGSRSWSAPTRPAPQHGIELIAHLGPRPSAWSPKRVACAFAKSKRWRHRLT